MEQAFTEARRLFPGARVQRMPHNNPGYDIEIDADAGRRYIEVKGTTSGEPRLLMSEGERRFSEANGDAYSLWVIFNVDTVSRRGTLLTNDGPVSRTVDDLRPTQWQGRFRPESYDR